MLWRWKTESVYSAAENAAKRGRSNVARPHGGYFLKDGTRVPGVTSILSRFKDSGGLLWWAFEQGKACQRGEIASLYDKRDEAADAGTLAHLMVEHHLNGEPMPDVTKQSADIVAHATQGFENYKRWERDNKITIFAQEMQLVSEQYRYGGSPDAIGQDSAGKICMIDFKTSSGLYVDFLVQVAAYCILWDENHPELAINGECHILRFSKEHGDFHHHSWSDLSDAKEQFLLFLRAYELDKKLKKRL